MELVGADKLIGLAVSVPGSGNGTILMVYTDMRSATPGAPSTRHVVYQVKLPSGKSVECLALNATFTG